MARAKDVWGSHLRSRLRLVLQELGSGAHLRLHTSLRAKYEHGVFASFSPTAPFPLQSSSLHLFAPHLSSRCFFLKPLSRNLSWVCRSVRNTMAGPLRLAVFTCLFLPLPLPVSLSYSPSPSLTLSLFLSPPLSLALSPSPSRYHCLACAWWLGVACAPVCLSLWYVVD